MKGDLYDAENIPYRFISGTGFGFVDHAGKHKRITFADQGYSPGGADTDAGPEELFRVYLYLF